VIEQVAAGQLVCDEGVRRVHEPGPRPDVRLVPAQPGDLRAARLAGQRRAAVREDLGLAEQRVEFGDLGGGPGVDPVEDAGPQRPHLRVAGQHARAEAAHRHRADLYWAILQAGRQGGDLAAEADHIPPPDPLGVLLGEAGSRHVHAVRDGALGQDGAVGGGQHRLGRLGADVDAEAAGTYAGAPAAARTDAHLGLTTGLATGLQAGLKLGLTRGRQSRPRRCQAAHTRSAIRPCNHLGRRECD
jgi:hypothetical protein